MLLLTILFYLSIAASIIGVLVYFRRRREINRGKQPTNHISSLREEETRKMEKDQRKMHNIKKAYNS